jgi:hypothetical protein
LPSFEFFKISVKDKIIILFEKKSDGTNEVASELISVADKFDEKLNSNIIYRVFESAHANGGDVVHKQINKYYEMLREQVKLFNTPEVQDYLLPTVDEPQIR